MIRVCSSLISKSYAEPNNKSLKSHNPNNPTSYIIYLEANILYGHSMMKIFQFGLIQKKIIETIISTMDIFLVVDLDNPGELHDLHNDYPLATENLKVAK